MLTLTVCFSAMDKMNVPTARSTKGELHYRNRRIPNDFYCSVHV